MLDQVNAIPTIGVKNLASARNFYENKLGLRPVGEKERGSSNLDPDGNILCLHDH